jgi:hypothetical protein
MGIRKNKNKVTARELTPAEVALAKQATAVALVAQASDALLDAVDANRAVVLASSDGIKRSAEILYDTIAAAQASHEARRNTLTIQAEDAERAAAQANTLAAAILGANG